MILPPPMMRREAFERGSRLEDQTFVSLRASKVAGKPLGWITNWVA
jgi:hypothetical protein